jgi:hypothetical protein
MQKAWQAHNREELLHNNKVAREMQQVTAVSTFGLPGRYLPHATAACFHCHRCMQAAQQDGSP